MDLERLKEKSRPYLSKAVGATKKALANLVLPPPPPEQEVETYVNPYEKLEGAEAVRAFYDLYLEERAKEVQHAKLFDKSLQKSPFEAAKAVLAAAAAADRTVNRRMGFRLPEEVHLSERAFVEPVALMDETRPLAVEIVQAWAVNSFSPNPDYAVPHHSLAHLRCSFTGSWLESDLTPESIGLDPIEGSRKEVFMQMVDPISQTFNSDYRDQVTEAFMANVPSWE